MISTMYNILNLKKYLIDFANDSSIPFYLGIVNRSTRETLPLLQLSEVSTSYKKLNQK